MKFIEINKFERLLVDGTGTTEVDKQTAIESAKGKIDGIVEKIDVKEMMLVQLSLNHNTLNMCIRNILRVFL